MKPIAAIEHKEVIEDAAEKGAKWLRSKYAAWILAAIAFAESVFAPILIDPFLIALIFAKRTLWKRYILISVVSSVIGGLAGYALGALFFETVGTYLLDLFGLQQSFHTIAKNLDANGFVFVLIGAFTPIPYKLVALASGFVEINLLTFLIASIFGRFLRLGLVGYAAYAVGPRALPIIQRNLHIFAAVIGVLLIGYIIYRVL